MRFRDGRQVMAERCRFQPASLRSQVQCDGLRRSGHRAETRGLTPEFELMKARPIPSNCIPGAGTGEVEPDPVRGKSADRAGNWNWNEGGSGHIGSSIRSDRVGLTARSILRPECLRIPALPGLIRS